MKFYWLVLGVLGVWRVTHLLNAEDGPWDLLLRLRRSVGNGFWGSLMDCFYCLSLWVGAPFALMLGQGWKERLLLWPALSGAAILLERATARPETAASTRHIMSRMRRKTMCCGKGRQQLTGMLQSGSGNRVRPTLAASRPAAPPIARSSTAVLQYQYLGRTAMTAVSPATGRQYRFDRPGAVQQVDARDRQWIERLPHIRSAARRAG